VDDEEVDEDEEISGSISNREIRTEKMMMKTSKISLVPAIWVRMRNMTWKVELRLGVSGEEVEVEDVNAVEDEVEAELEMEIAGDEDE